MQILISHLKHNIIYFDVKRNIKSKGYTLSQIRSSRDSLFLSVSPLSPPSSFSRILFASDNFADRLSRFQQRDAVAYLSERTGAKGRTLTVLFKFVRGRTKVLTAQRRRIVAPLVRALTGTIFSLG